MIRPWKGIRPRVDATAFVAPGAAVIGDVEIGPRSSVWFGAVMRGDDAPIRVGAESNLQDNCVVHVLERDGVRTPCVVGDRATIGHAVTLHSCTVRDLAIVGMGSTVLDRVEIGERVFVGAGSLVPPGMRVPPGVLVLGVPARVVRPLRADELAWLAESAAHYVRRASEYLREPWGREGRDDDEAGGRGTGAP